MIQNKYMEEEDHFTQTLLPTLIAALAAAAMATRLRHCSPSLSLYTLHILTPLLLIVLSHVCLFIGKYGGSSSSTTTAAHGLIHLSMVGATTIDKW
jgi:hypothetical protein